MPPRLVAGRIELSFRWSGDRWSHSFAVRGVGQEAVGASWHSVEGPAGGLEDPAWPASPAITELSVVEAAGAVVGVGRAGRSHFSVSFTADRTTPDSLLVECACRVDGPVGWVGSRYQAGEEAGGAFVEIPASIGETDASTAARTIFWAYRVGPDGPGLRLAP